MTGGEDSKPEENSVTWEVVLTHNSIHDGYRIKMSCRRQAQVRNRR